MPATKSAHLQEGKHQAIDLELPICQLANLSFKNDLVFPIQEDVYLFSGDCAIL